ncbi:hypothetical protein ACR8AL_07525 [Clavibacter sepedonicus]|uniref:hypothetical protein n=1 Tax=Clavibacter TaxID=1573 RepID=UPI0002DF9350|nr:MULTISPECIES: hypothetical protein [Clavibacter]MBD5382455.1 hypothetical protein [Clavibacter sp.]OQJ50983.1 hypothetical protein B5P20_16305 [Clavibacter sepedonicus]UUK67207.1 hypothetical protein LRE50_15730 [Clavibacter sepedonicus]
MTTTTPTATTTPVRHPMYAAALDPDTPRQALVRRCHQGHPLVTVAELRQQNDGTWTTHILERAGFGGLLPGEFGPTRTWQAAAVQLAAWTRNQVHITQ